MITIIYLVLIPKLQDYIILLSDQVLFASLLVLFSSVLVLFTLSFYMDHEGLLKGRNDPNPCTHFLSALLSISNF